MLVFRGDFETGDLSQWSKTQQVAADRLQVVAAPVKQGTRALRVEVRQGDDPINASGNRAEVLWSPLEAEGNERWYAWSTLWPTGYPSSPTWQLFAQWHHTGLTGSPPLELYVNGETMSLRVSASTVVWSAKLQRGAWHDFLLHVKWSSDAKVGFVELWYDGQPAGAKTAAATLYPGQGTYLKMGLYRNDTIMPTGVLYHDGLLVGTTRADVEPLAAGDGGAAGPVDLALPATGEPSDGGGPGVTGDPAPGTGLTVSHGCAAVPGEVPSAAPLWAWLLLAGRIVASTCSSRIQRSRARTKRSPCRTSSSGSG